MDCSYIKVQDANLTSMNFYNDELSVFLITRNHSTSDKRNYYSIKYQIIKVNLNKFTCKTITYTRDTNLKILNIIRFQEKKY